MRVCCLIDIELRTCKLQQICPLYFCSRNESVTMAASDPLLTVIGDFGRWQIAICAVNVFSSVLFIWQVITNRNWQRIRLIVYGTLDIQKCYITTAYHNRYSTVVQYIMTTNLRLQWQCIFAYFLEVNNFAKIQSLRETLKISFNVH